MNSYTVKLTPFVREVVVEADNEKEAIEKARIQLNRFKLSARFLSEYHRGK